MVRHTCGSESSSTTANLAAATVRLQADWEPADTEVIPCHYIECRWLTVGLESANDVHLHSLFD